MTRTDLTVFSPRIFHVEYIRHSKIFHFVLRSIIDSADHRNRIPVVVRFSRHYFRLCFSPLRELIWRERCGSGRRVRLVVFVLFTGFLVVFFIFRASRTNDRFSDLRSRMVFANLSVNLICREQGPAGTCFGFSRRMLCSFVFLSIRRHRQEGAVRLTSVREHVPSFAS